MLLHYLGKQEIRNCVFSLKCCMLFHHKTRNTVENITWLELNHPSLSKRSTGCISQDIASCCLLLTCSVLANSVTVSVAKFYLNVFVVSASGGQKPQFLANFDIIGGSCTDPLVQLQAKFHLNVFVVSASGGQKPQFWANFDIFGGSCTDSLLPMRAKFGEL